MDEELIGFEEDISEIVIDVEESIGWSAGDTATHSMLPDKNTSDQHIIDSITGLSSELEDLKSSNKSVYSNKVGVASYYKWIDGTNHETFGQFVSVASIDTIKVCNYNNGDSIFGVTVNDAAFISGLPKHCEEIRNNFDGSYTHTIVKDDGYALVATSGFALVRCSDNISVGDYVISDENGFAKKAESMNGYRVVAIDDDNVVKYASIALGVQADVTNKIFAEVNSLDNRLDQNEALALMANNLANQAMNEIKDIDSSKLVTSDKLANMEASVNNAVITASGALDEVLRATGISVEAKNIANDAVNSAENIKKEVIDKADEALQTTANLREEFDDVEGQITDVKDKVTIVTKTIRNQYEVVPTWSTIYEGNYDVVYYVEESKTYRYYENNEWKETDDAAEAGIPVAIAGIQAKTDENSSNINSLTSWQDSAKTSMARIEQKADENGAYIQSTVSNLYKYSVGPHSQSYGFTLEQAYDILEEGMIYVPTDNVTEEYLFATDVVEFAEDKDVNCVYYQTTTLDGVEYKTYWYAEYNVETKEYEWKQSNDIPKLQIDFLRSFLYYWGRVGGDGPYRWIEVDKDYSVLELNTSFPSVHFTNQAPPTADTTHGYWYKTGDATDIDGNVIEEEYEKHALYKWTRYTTRNEYDDVITQDAWIKVATLAENSRSRAVSQIRQESNSILLDISNTYGAVAGFGATITDTAAKVNSIASWPKSGGTHRLATIEQSASGDDSHLVLAAGTKDDGSPNLLSGATIVLNDDDKGSYIQFNADKINFTAGDIGERNLLLHSDFSSQSNQDGCTFDEDVVTFENDTLGETVLFQLDVSPYGINNMKGKTLTLSMDYLVEEEIIYGETNPWVGFELVVYHDDGTKSYLDWYGGNEFPASQESGWKRYSHTAEVDSVNIIKDVVCKFYFRDATGKVKLRHPKVEIGSTATAWTRAIEDRVSTSQIGNKMNWKMEPTQCVWWNEKTDESNPLMRLDDEGLYISGQVEATKGHVGGWEISGRSLINTTDDGLTYGFETPSADSRNVFAIASPYRGTWDKAPFRITKDGSMYAKKGEIGSWVISDKGYLGGKAIVGNTTYGFGLDCSAEGFEKNYNMLAIGHMPDDIDGGWSQACFRVTADGSMHSRSGKIGNINIMEDGLHCGGAGILTGNVHGNTSLLDNLTHSIRFYAKHSTTSTTQDINITQGSGGMGKYSMKIPNAMIIGSAQITHYSYDGGASLYEDKNKSYIKYDIDNNNMTIYHNFGKINNSNVAILTLKYQTSSYNGFRVLDDGFVYAPGMRVGDGTQRVRIGNYNDGVNTAIDLYDTANNFGLRIKHNEIMHGERPVIQFEPNLRRLKGTWYIESDIIDLSDRNAKHSIIDIDERYSNMFDRLSPKAFKYNNGESDRYHTGLIAQEVEEAVVASGLTTQEFAAVCYETDEDGNKHDYGIRYSELIAILIKEVQKLKQEMKELRENG